MPFLLYLPLIIWSGLVGAAQSDAKKTPQG
jgi:hypothetical protein